MGQRKGKGKKLHPGSAPGRLSPEEAPCALGSTLCPGALDQALLPSPVRTNKHWSTALTDEPKLRVARDSTP